MCRGLMGEPSEGRGGRPLSKYNHVSAAILAQAVFGISPGSNIPVPDFGCSARAKPHSALCSCLLNPAQSRQCRLSDQVGQRGVQNPGWRMPLRICDVARARRRLAYVKTFIEPSASGKWVCCWEPGPLRSELRAPAAQQATTPAPPPPTSDADSEASDTTDNVKAEIQEKEDPHGQNDHVGRGGQRHS